MFKIADYKTTIDGILKEVPQRTQDVLNRRFGIGEERETLESIGKEYNLTRERIRQIENKGLDTIQNSPKFSKLKEPFIEIKKFIDGNGGLKKEDALEISLVPVPEYRPYLLFLLKVGDRFFYHPDSPELYSLWKTNHEAPDYAKKIGDFLVDLMEKEKRLFTEQEIVEISSKYTPKILRIKLPKDYVVSYIEATKKIEENPFGEFGPSYWSEVNPKGIRDEAYIVLKNEGGPLHFRDLSKIMEDRLSHPVHENTLHNELIKNDNFVLVGRGIYALKDWGYKIGTVKDIIKKILKESKTPLSKEEIIKKVKEQRMVKDTTIVLNLQHFKKNKQGKYSL